MGAISRSMRSNSATSIGRGPGQAVTYPGLPNAWASAREPCIGNCAWRNQLRYQMTCPRHLNKIILIYMRHFNFLPVLLACLMAPAYSAEPLSTLVVNRAPLPQGFAAEAVVEAVQQTTVGSQVAGRVLEMRVEAGQRVGVGELLMRIDAREAEAAERAAEAALVNARLQFERQQKLQQRQFVSPAAVDQARAAFDAAAAQRAAAGATQSHARVVAPVGGIVARRLVELGDMVMPGTPLFALYQPGQLRVVVQVPQARLSAIGNGRGARVEFPELGRSVEATAVQVLPTADAATHTTTVRVVLPADSTVRPGMFARVIFATGQAEKLAVPVSAVLRRGEVAAVYVQAADGRLSFRQLRLGERLGEGRIEVLAGLADGEQVVLDPVQAGIRLQEARR